MKEIYKKRLTATFLLLTFLSYNFSLAVFAADIQLNTSQKTNTTITPNGNVTDIFTNTTTSDKTIGINSFKRFDVNNGDTVNFQLMNDQNKLVNLIYDTRASQINGIVNSYINATGKIGGNMLFANPNGFVIGKNGVFNVGSLTLITPTRDAMETLISDGKWDDKGINRLINFSFGDDEYLINGNKYNSIELAASEINVKGKINSGAGVDLISGSAITLEANSEINANMDFTVSDSGISVTPKTTIQGSETSALPSKFAMQDGKNIVIVASNKNASYDNLSAIVNLNGKINANGGDLVAKTEVFQTSIEKESVREYGDTQTSTSTPQVANRHAKSEITVGKDAEINANNVSLKAVSKISGFDDNPLGALTDDLIDIFEPVVSVINFVVDYFVHLANVDTQINIESGAKVTATNDLNINALSDMSEITTSAIYSVLVAQINANVTLITSKTNATIKNGAIIGAKNLNLDSITNLKLNTTTKTSNLSEILVKKHPGSYAINVAITDIENKAIIENGATLTVDNDINVLAKTSAYHSSLTQNGLVPVVDKNQGPVGAAVDIIIKKVKNEAIMNANATIDGNLTVEADYKGKVSSSISATSAGSATSISGGAGEDGELDGIFKHFLKLDKIKSVIARANAKYNNLGASGAIGVIVDEVKSNAAIGYKDSEKNINIKPKISASKVIVKSTSLDDGSSLYPTSGAENSKKITAGAVAVHYKDIDANAKAYGDFTLNNTKKIDQASNGDTYANDALQIISKTEIISSKAHYDWINNFLKYFDDKNWSDALQAVKDSMDSYDGNSFSDFIGKAGSLTELLNGIKDGSMDILAVIDFGNLGAGAAFSTFANSQASAAAELGKTTTAISGAIAITLYNANAHAILDDNSTVVIKSTDVALSGVSVIANSNNTVLTGATLIDILHAADVFSGANARDGSAYGMTGTFSYSDSDVIANIGKNVTITNDSNTTDSKVGDVSVIAKEKGTYVTINAGSSSPDNTGLSGAIGITTLGSGTTKAFIDENTNIKAQNANVLANKNDTIVNTVVAFANGQKSFGFGLSGIILSDTVEAYIAGQLKAAKGINIDATYDKTVANANLNVGVAKKGSDNTAEPSERAHQDALENFEDVFVPKETKWHNLKIKWENKTNKIEHLANKVNAGYDITRHENPDKKTIAGAGGVNVNYAKNTVKAYVADGAKLKAQDDIKVNAKVVDSFYDISGAAAVNGKTGAGASVLMETVNNTIEAYIGNATVDTAKSLDITAKDKFNLLAITAGVATGKDTAGVGNVSFAVQENNVTSAIKSGAQINTNIETNEQSVNVKSDVDSRVIKIAGAVALQYENSANAKPAVGMTIDTDIVINQVNAYIDNAVVNASKGIDINATNNDKLIAVDVAGSASSANSAGAGTMGAYIGINEINAYINNSEINNKTFDEETDLSKQDVNIAAKSTFKGIDVIGSGAGGKKTGAGATFRVDVIANDINTYIKNSTVKAERSELINRDEMQQISIVAAGSVSTQGNAGSGALSVLADVTSQKNYIENSDVTTGNLLLDSDKVLKNVSVIGAVAAGIKGASVGVSAIGIGASHEIETYIKNSNIKSTKDINLYTDFEQDSYIIALGGSGGKNISASGVVNIFINDYDMKTYVEADSSSTKKTLASDGSIDIRTKADVKTVNVNGNVSVSGSSVAAGGIVNLITYNSKLKAGIDGVTVTAGRDLDILARAKQDHDADSVGAEAGKEVAAGGIVDTITIKQDIDAYLKNSDVTLDDGDFRLNSLNQLELQSGLGNATASAGNASVGGVIQTLVVNQDVKSEIINSTVTVKRGSILKDSTAITKIVATLIGLGGAKDVAVEGTVATHVLNIDASSIIEDSTLIIANGKNKKIANTSTNENDITTTVINGKGAGTASVGGSVYSLVDNSTANALVKNTTIKEPETTGTTGTTTKQKEAGLVNTAEMNSKYISTLLEGSGAGTVAVDGTVFTQVLNSKADATVDGGNISGISDITVKSNNVSDTVGVVGQGEGAGTVAVGATINTLVSKKKSKAEIKNSTITSSGNIIVNADANNTLDSTVVGGNGSGEVSVVGMVNTIVSSDEINAGITNSTVTTSVANDTANDNGILINASDNMQMVGRAFGGTGSGLVAVSAPVVTGVLNNSVKSYVENSDLKSTNADIILTSVADEAMGKTDNPYLVVGGAGAGVAGVGASVNTLVLNSISSSKITGKKTDGIYAGDKIALNAKGMTELILGTGTAGGSGIAGVGATINTVVIGKTIEAIIDNTTVQSSSIDIETYSKDKIQNHVYSLAIAGVTDVAGIINTDVINSNLEAGIKNSIVYSNDINVKSEAKADFLQTAGGGSIGSTVAAGGTVLTNVAGYKSSAYIDNSKVKAKDKSGKAKKINVNSSADTNYEIYAVSAAFSAGASVEGIVQTNVINNTVEAYVTGNTNGISSEKLTVEANDANKFKTISNSNAVGQVGVGATIVTNVISSTILSYIGNTVTADEITVNAIGKQDFSLYTLGLGVGSTSGYAGSININIINATARAYIAKNSTVTANESLNVGAKNETTINGGVGADGLGTSSLGATIAINKITNTTEAYSADDVTIDAKKIDINAHTASNIGTEESKFKAGAGAESLVVSVIGAAIVNRINNKTQAYIGKNNKINKTITEAEQLNITAQDDAKIYEITGNLTASVLGAGVGLAIGSNNIKNTTLAYIDSGSDIEMSSGNITLKAISNETLDVYSTIVGGGALGGLDGGVMLVKIGGENNNDTLEELTSDDKKPISELDNLETEAVKQSDKYKEKANTDFVTYYNKASDDIGTAVKKANTNVNYRGEEKQDTTTTTGSTTTTGTAATTGSSSSTTTTGSTSSTGSTSTTTDEDKKIKITVNNITKKDSTYSLAETSTKAGSSTTTADNVKESTSAYINSNTTIKAKDVTISAKNTDNVDMKIDGFAAALGVAVGVVVGISEVKTSINSFVSSGTKIEAKGKINIIADSVDKQNLALEAASGGVLSGSGVRGKTTSKKNTKAYVGSSSTLTAEGDLSITSQANEAIYNNLAAKNIISGVGVGVSNADSIINGKSEVEIGRNVTLKSTDGNLSIIVDAIEAAEANAEAASVGAITGTGAEADAKIEKTGAITINADTKLASKSKTLIKSRVANTAVSYTDGRAGGGISAGGTKTTSKIKHTGRIRIADSTTTNKASIDAQSVEIVSNVQNDANAKTAAGAGAAVGIYGSGVYTNIDATNNVYVGKDINIKTTNGNYRAVANTKNTYKSFNDSSAYGAVGVATAFIGNSINSTATTTSNANVESKGAIIIEATNSVIKAASANYDLYGGSGAVADVGCASLTDAIAMFTTTELGGDYAHATGEYENGYVTVSSNSILDVNEKVDVDAVGALAITDGDVKLNSTVTTKTTIKNKDVKSKKDNINFLAKSDIDIYTKSNVESSGIVSAATGESITKSNSAITSVIVDSGVNSLSGRDTYIEAICDKNIEAHMYAITKAAIGLGSALAEAYNNSKTTITIYEGAKLKSNDTMNLIAAGDTKYIIAEKDERGSVLGFPVHDSENPDPVDISTSSIVLDGSIESGLGSKRTLTIDSYDDYTSNGINATGKKKVGEISTEDISADILAYEKSQASELKSLNSIKELENNSIEKAQNEIKNIEEQIALINEKNDGHDIAISNAQTIISNNDSISNIDSVVSAWSSAFDSSNNKLNSSFKNTLSKYSADSNLSEVVTAYNNYSNNSSSANLAILKSSIKNLNSIKTELQTDSADLANIIISKSANVDYTNNEHLNAFIQEEQIKVDSNNISLNECNNAINNLRDVISTADTNIAKIDNQIAEVNSKYEPILEKLRDQVEKGGTIEYYSFIIDDVHVHSGETNITGNVTGSGSITTCGNNFEISVINNSIADLVFDDLIIDKNASGLINLTEGSTIADTITKNVADGNNYKISIINTVYANAPGVELNNENGYGDMVFQGDIENVQGSVSLQNNTGNILTSSGIKANSIKMVVPNGSLTTGSLDSTISVAGANSKGAITAKGDIEITSRVMDINGLIQSGSEINSVTIPEFTVTYRGKKYWIEYEDNNVVKELKKAVTDGYYYVDINGNGELDSNPDEIKVYFKVTDASDTTDVKGEVVLFNTKSSAGNITLTGNIISTTENGKINLIDGYGHINVVNNSKYALNTNGLDASEKMKGTLTIRDFYFEDGEGSNITNIDLENQSWLFDNALTYKLSISSNSGKILKNSNGSLANVTFNGKFDDEATYSTREDGAKIATINYTPGYDAYYIKSNTTEVTEKVYVKRSWWTELWHGKKYVETTKIIASDPVYDTARNPIKITFQGYEKPQIDVTSDASIIMSKSINAIGGDINLTSNNGSISFEHANKSLMADNININAEKGNIGDMSGIFIQADVSNDGSLTANAKNVALNVNSNNEYDIDITAEQKAYLRAQKGNFSNSNKKLKIHTDVLQISADEGSINLDNSKNQKMNIVSQEINADAKKDITIITNSDLIVGTITSDDKSLITLGSKNGSIYASSTAEYQYINGGNVILEAINGQIGTKDNNLHFISDGIFNVNAKSDIYLSSSDAIRTDLIKSTIGSVNLDADYGIISAKSSDNLAYNIYSAGDVNLVSSFGNIENVGINTDGIVNASAGYYNENPSGISDVLIYLRSKHELTPEYLNSLASDEERIDAYNEHAATLKDMKIGTVKASKQVSIYSEKSILNANENSNIKAEYVTLSAADGDIGSENSPITLNANRYVTAYAGDGKSVYLTSDKNLKIDKIQSYTNTNDNTSGSLENVVISTKGNIINSSQDAESPNITAKNISLVADKDIGSIIRYITVDTTDDSSNKGLTFKSQNAYINGLNDNLNIVSGDVENNLYLSAEEDIDIDSVSTKNLNTSSKGNTTITNADVDGNLTANAGKNATINAEVGGNLTANAKNTITIDDTDIDGNLTANAKNTITIDDTDIDGNLTANAKNVIIDDVDLKGNFNSNVDNLTLKTDNDLNIGTIKGNTKDYAENVNITSGKSIHNGKNNNSYNIFGKNININAQDEIGTESKPLNIKLAKGNNINANASNNISFITSGETANISNIKTSNLTLTGNNDINIKNLDVDNVKLTTSASNLEINNAVINDSGQINVSNNKIVINNKSYAPVIDADIQLKLATMPAYIKVHGNKVITNETNVVGNNGNLSVNNSKTYSMDNIALLSNETALKNTKVIDKTIEKTDSLVYHMPNKKRYKNNYNKRYTQGIIINQIDEIVTPQNAFSIINLTNISEEENLVYNKISSL